MQGSSEPCSKPSGRAAARLAVGTGLVLAMAGVQCAAAGATVAVDSARHRGAIDIRASAVLAADAGTAWRVLTEYNRYTDFIPDLRLSRVVARRGSTVTVEQSGDAALWLFKVPLDITFEVREIPPDRLQSRAVAGSLRTLTSSYTLTPVKMGTRLEYFGRIEPGFAFLGDIEKAAVERNVARQFQALADEIERQGATARAPPTADAK